MPRRRAAFPCYVSASHGLSRVLDEPVNPRKREGESSPVNAEVMTGVATLKDPRRSAIADIASRLSSRSSALHPSLFLYLSISLFLFPRPLPLRLSSLLSLSAGSDDTRVPYSAVNHGQREVERAICPAVPKTKIADPKKTTFICIEIFGRAFIPKPAAPVDDGVFAERLRRFLFRDPPVDENYRHQRSSGI